MDVELRIEILANLDVDDLGVGVAAPTSISIERPLVTNTDVTN